MGDNEGEQEEQPAVPNPEKDLADAAKAKADARTAEATAAKAELELAEKDSPLAKAQRDAEARKAIAEADKAAATARQGQLTAMIPDLSKIEGGTIEVKGDQTLLGSALAQRALGAAAESAAVTSLEALKDKETWRILVTSDAALATSDSVYFDVVTGLQQLDKAAEKILEEKAAPAGLMPVDAAAALATAVPSALSLLSPTRTLSSAAVTIANLAAAAATAGALKLKAPSRPVIHDDIRTLPSGGVVHTKLTDLEERRQQLLGRKISLEDEKARTAEEVTTLGEGVKELADLVKAATVDQKPGLQAQLDLRKGELATRRQRLGEAEVRIGLIDSVMAAIQTFTATLRTTPEGAARSPLATAVLREQLHGAGSGNPASAPRFTHVLFVQAEPGSTHQVVEDRPLWFKDRFSAIGVVNITYMLIELGQSEIQAAGSASGRAVAKGKIGADISIDVSP